MPVVTTMTILALMRGDGDGAGLFFDPDLMRDMMKDSLEGVADGELQESLIVVDDLASALQQYGEIVNRSIDAYIEETSDGYTDASELVERLAPLDRKRTEMMNTVIESRRRLLEILDREQWDSVFE